MEGSTIEQGDSDSGESWTMLEDNILSDEINEPSSIVQAYERVIQGSLEKDEDTDGISIISDSDHESISPCEITLESQEATAESLPTENTVSHYSSHYPSLNETNNLNNVNNNPTRINDGLFDDNCKLKTYVHRRNKRLSTILNIIVLGSVITAAGVAVGHMWGVRDDCSMHYVPSVNKILSNLYKLQEENAYLRGKLKEFTAIKNAQMQKLKMESEKMPYQQNRCHKVFEESLVNENPDKVTKCVDDQNDLDLLQNHLTLPEYESDFITDMNKLKNVYKNNKVWLDNEIASKMRFEKQSKLKTMKDKQSDGISYKENKYGKSLNERLENDSVNGPRLKHNTPNVLVTLEDDMLKDTMDKNKVTYADSLKLETIKSGNGNKHKRETSQAYVTQENQKGQKVKNDNAMKKESVGISDDFTTNYDLRKDHAYYEQKNKKQKKREHRYKFHRKQKVKNNEQFEDINAEHINRHKQQNSDVKYLHYNDDKDSVETGKSSRFEQLVQNFDEKSDDDTTWFQKRAAIRSEARKKLDRKLSQLRPTNAGWYFRRMQKREQCRVKNDNSTSKRHSKRKINFKIKH